MKVVNETASCLFFCQFKIVTTKEIEKYSFSGSGGIELKPTTSPNPIHHEHELQLALDAIRKDLRISSALDSDDIHKALLKAGIKELI